MYSFLPINYRASSFPPSWTFYSPFCHIPHLMPSISITLMSYNNNLAMTYLSDLLHAMYYAMLCCLYVKRFYHRVSTLSCLCRGQSDTSPSSSKQLHIIPLLMVRIKLPKLSQASLTCQIHFQAQWFCICSNKNIPEYFSSFLILQVLSILIQSQHFCLDRVVQLCA